MNTSGGLGRKLAECQVELGWIKERETKVKKELFSLCQSAIISNNRLLSHKLFDLFMLLEYAEHSGFYDEYGEPYEYDGSAEYTQLAQQIEQQFKD